MWCLIATVMRLSPFCTQYSIVCGFGVDGELSELMLRRVSDAGAVLPHNRAMSDVPSATGVAALGKVDVEEGEPVSSASFSNTDPSVSATLVSLFHSEVILEVK